MHLAVKPARERERFMQHVMRRTARIFPSVSSLLIITSFIDEEYFAVPLQVVRRKLDGLRDSAVTSSVWKSDFKHPLETRPDLEVFMLDFAVPECDACNLASRISTRSARISGIPYDRLTFKVSSASFSITWSSALPSQSLLRTETRSLTLTNLKGR